MKLGNDTVLEVSVRVELMKEIKTLDSSTGLLAKIQTPFDDMLPSVEEPSARFYLDSMRIYLALGAGTLSFEDALQAVEVLKENPEFARFPADPTQISINPYFTKKVLENLKTLKKFNLATRDSIRSAFSFAFLVNDVPLNKVDLDTLSVLVSNPRASLTNIGNVLSLAPRTISRSIDRLEERHTVRFRALMDYTAWGINTVLVFFTPKEGIDWQYVEDEIITFPFIKTLLKTTMSNLGYFSIIIPGGNTNLKSFTDSVKLLSKDVFDYVSLHHEIATGYDRNLSLYAHEKWTFPNAAKIVLEDHEIILPKTNSDYISCIGPQKGLSRLEFEIASIAKLSSRATPSDIALSLSHRNLDVDPKKVTSTIRKMYERGIMKPYVVFSLGLSSDFCFEIVCNQEWRERIKSVLPLLPYTIFFESPRGLIVWASVPGVQQVEYYQMFRNLEEKVGIRSVNSIMTIEQVGSRSILDLVSNWKYTKTGFTVPTNELDITQYISDIN